MSDKPLAEGIENWAKKLEEEWEIEIAQHLRGTILLIKDFAAEHLTEQTEPSAAQWEFVSLLVHGTLEGHTHRRCDLCATNAALLMEHVNAERRRIRELLVGKETP